MAKLHSLSFCSTTSIPFTFFSSSSSLISPNLCFSYSRPTTNLSVVTSFRPHHNHTIYISCSSSATSASILTVDNPSLQTDDEDGVSKTRLLAQNVPWTCSSDDVRTLFQQFGTVVDVELSMHNKTRNRGLAFVEMSSAEEAAAAFEKLESFEFQGRTLRMTYAKPKKKKVASAVQSKPPVVYNLFVANLSFEARAKDLKELFKSGGCDVVSAEIIFQDNPRRSSGYGFVSFKTKKEADEALSNFQGKELMGRPIRVAPSKRFVKLESEINSPIEDEQDMSTDSMNGVEQSDGGDSS